LAGRGLLVSSADHDRRGRLRGVQRAQPHPAYATCDSAGRDQAGRYGVTYALGRDRLGGCQPPATAHQNSEVGEMAQSARVDVCCVGPDERLSSVCAFWVLHRGAQR